MNLNLTNKLSAIIGVICGLIFLPLTTQAAFTDSGSIVLADAGSSGTYYSHNANTPVWSATGSGQITGSNAWLELVTPTGVSALYVRDGVIIGDHLEVFTKAISVMA
jgi:hypothetical protein